MATEETTDIEMPPTTGKASGWIGETARFLVILFLIAYVLRSFVTDRLD